MSSEQVVLEAVRAVLAEMDEVIAASPAAGRGPTGYWRHQLSQAIGRPPTGHGEEGEQG